MIGRFGYFSRLVAEDAGAGEAQRTIAGLKHLGDVVRLDHRIDHHDVVAIGHGTGCDLQQFERQQVGAEHLTARRVGAMREEQHDLFLLGDHGITQLGRWASRPRRCSS
jgi:hypothetical protein